MKGVAEEESETDGLPDVVALTEIVRDSRALRDGLLVILGEGELVLVPVGSLLPDAERVSLADALFEVDARGDLEADELCVEEIDDVFVGAREIVTLEVFEAAGDCDELAVFVVSTEGVTGAATVVVELGDFDGEPVSLGVPEKKGVLVFTAESVTVEVAKPVRVRDKRLDIDMRAVADRVTTDESDVRDVDDGENVSRAESEALAEGEFVTESVREAGLDEDVAVEDTDAVNDGLLDDERDTMEENVTPADDVTVRVAIALCVLSEVNEGVTVTVALADTVPLAVIVNVPTDEAVIRLAVEETETVACDEIDILDESEEKAEGLLVIDAEPVAHDDGEAEGEDVDDTV